MPLASTTSDIHMINIALTAADGSGLHWQDPTQMIPLGINHNPEAFVAAIRDGLPLVNNLRILFNEYSFNPDGSMNPEFERFLAAAAAEGFQITLAYGGGDAQNIGIGDADHPALTNAEAYAALEANYADVAGAWDSMMDWMDGHATTAAAVYGWELMNEAAGYRHSVRANGADANYSQDDFVGLYAEHCAALAQLIDARADGRILVGGWAYNGDFLTLASTQVNGVSAIDYLRAAVGADLVWSAHFYPGWMGTNTLTDPTALVARLEQLYGMLAGDDLLITETNIDGEVDNPAVPMDYSDILAATFEWFADNGVGLGWYPGAQTGSSHLIYVENDGSVTIRHQHSLAHALNAYSLGSEQPGHAGDEVIVTQLTDARLRNEDYEIAAGEATFDALTKMGTAFGFAGADTLKGTGLSNDFLFGGAGRDVLRATGGDDFLFGQGDDDHLIGGSGMDHLFGGLGNDTLDAGTGVNMMAGGQGNDLYVLRNARDVIREFAGSGIDQVETALRVFSLAADANVSVEHLTYTGPGNFRGTGNALTNRLRGGDGRDTLSGGDGRDTLDGGSGDDRLTGGTGADHFSFGPAMGHDLITDFANDSDTVELLGIAGVLTVAQALSHASQIGADVLFDFGTDGSLTLANTQIATLSNDLVVG